MIRPPVHQVTSSMRTLRTRARRFLVRHTLTEQERYHLTAGRPQAAVFSASLGLHPHR